MKLFLTDQTEKIKREKKRFPGTINTSNVSVVACGHWVKTGVQLYLFIVFKGNPPFYYTHSHPEIHLKSRHQSKLYVFNMNLQWVLSLHCTLRHWCLLCWVQWDWQLDIKQSGWVGRGEWPQSGLVSVHS